MQEEVVKNHPIFYLQGLMRRHIIALFGEAEKGAFHTPHFVKELPQLIDRLGQPPQDSKGLYFAIQALLFEKELIFFRVQEEGFSYIDYFQGLKTLENKDSIDMLSALCLPGVGDLELIQATQPICEKHQSLLITTQKDFYDYITSKKQTN